MPFSMGEVGVGYEIDSVQSLHVFHVHDLVLPQKKKSRPSYLLLRRYVGTGDDFQW